MPEKNARIRLALAVVDRLARDVMNAFWAVPKRGAEVGGLLLGRKGAAGEGGPVLIEDYELVPCEHERGPSYQLSERDLSRLEESIAGHNATRDRCVIGYFRSHTREGLELEEEDRSLITRYFADPACVVLLVKPFASRPPVAGFFFWEDGMIRPGASYLEFPFSRTELIGTGQPSAEPEETPDPDPTCRPLPAEPSFGKQPGLPEPGPLLRGWRQIRRNGLTIAALTALVLALFQFGLFRLLSSRDTPVSAVAREAVALHVEHSGRYLQITWDRNTPAVAKAQRGLLRIADGTYGKELVLDTAQLRNGSLAYLPVTDDVRFELNLVGKHATVTESLRVVTPRPAEPVPPDSQWNSLPPPPSPVNPKPVEKQPAVRKHEPRMQQVQKRRPKARHTFFDDGL